MIFSAKHESPVSLFAPPEIDTSKVSVYLCSGEYDPSALGPGEELSRQIKGSKYEIIKGASHFAMTDDYERFRKYLIPVLDETRTIGSKPQN